MISSYSESDLLVLTAADVLKPFIVFEAASGMENHLVNLTGGVSFYPNPSKEEIVILLKAYPADRIQAIIYDMSGKEVLRKVLSEVKQELNIASLTEARYILSVENHGAVIFSDQFVK